MNEIIKDEVIEGFQKGVENAIKLANQQNPPEWQHNPLHMTAIILGAINETKRTYKEMLRENNETFEIDVEDVDAFIEDIGQAVYEKYFY